MIWLQIVLALCGITLALTSGTWLGRSAGIALMAVGIVGIIFAVNRRRASKDKGE